uniref:Putative ixostatin n=1 Tax=Ixodes ricinus TaxID=34613 RepID=A0A0K8RC53_IXORI
MIRMMILPFSVVLLSALGYLHAAQPKQDADDCSPGLGDYITKVCSSSGMTFTEFSGCTYTCQKPPSGSQTYWSKRNLPDGLPCGKCRQCCGGTCTRVQFNFESWLTVRPCTG